MRDAPADALGWVLRLLVITTLAVIAGSLVRISRTLYELLQVIQ